MSESLIHPDWINKALAAGNRLSVLPELREIPEGHDLVVAHAEVANSRFDVVVVRSPGGELRVIWVEGDNAVEASHPRGRWKDRYPSAKTPKERTDGDRPFTALQTLMRDGDIAIPNIDGWMQPFVEVLVWELRSLTIEGDDTIDQPGRYLPPVLAAFLSACTSGLESPVHRPIPDPSAPTAPTMPDDLMVAKERYEGWAKDYREAKDEAERLEGIARNAEFEADIARRKADRLGREVDALQRDYAALIVRLGAVPVTISQHFPATDPDRLTT